MRMKSATGDGVLQALNNTHARALAEADQLEKALTNLQFEGKSSFGRNLKQVCAVCKFLQRDLMRHMQVEERIVFTFIETHLPKLERIIFLFRSEHLDFVRNLKAFKFQLQKLAEGRTESRRGTIIEDIKISGVYLVNLLKSHIYVEDECFCKMVECELSSSEKKILGEQIKGHSSKFKEKYREDNGEAERRNESKRKNRSASRN